MWCKTAIPMHDVVRTVVNVWAVFWTTIDVSENNHGIYPLHSCLYTVITFCVAL